MQAATVVVPKFTTSKATLVLDRDFTCDHPSPRHVRGVTYNPREKTVTVGGNTGGVGTVILEHQFGKIELMPFADYVEQYVPVADVRDSVTEAVGTEIAYQIKKWGPKRQHRADFAGWILLILARVTKMQEAWSGATDDEAAKHELRKVLAVATVAARDHGIPRREEKPSPNLPKVVDC